MTVVGRDRRERHIEIPGRGELVLAWAVRTDTGRKRTANEDSAVVGFPVFAVADGMGGHAAGDRASAIVVERLGRERGAAFLDLRRLERAIVEAAHEIDELGDATPSGMGTTLTGAALVVDDGEPVFAVFNIGDSRVYRFEGNELVQLTVDHSVVQELVDAGSISRAEAERHPEANVITRAIGFHDDPDPDVWAVPARPGLRLLMCSDGLTKEVGDDRIRLHLAAGMPPGETAAALVDAALAAGGRDNVTVVVVDVLDLRDTSDTRGPR
ncbi:PP2C family protein-serine/threonine phosphatase [Pseudolysinimonas sp.]|uniref:PP2C family protein-serine/threonine phosphatase n=1 Tax=Pseudolysinimonas sp. TaxID=2680009 RepID=UPI003F820F22